MDLLSATEKTSFSIALGDLFDTFCKDIYVYKTPQKVVLSQDANFNFAYSDAQPSATVDYTPVSGAFKAVVSYIRRDQISETQTTVGVPIDINKDLVRIKTKMDAVDYLKDAERVDLEGKTYNILSHGSPRFVFEAQFYIFFLQERT